MGWTDEQQAVIDHRNNNMLVSAAAGSGKTAVLIARILSLLTDEENPMDIDRLLIVTFTNAAAQEMKSRLYKAIQEESVKNPDNRHLAHQLTLISKAMVCTIDSFCLHILRNYFNEIGLDPSFRVGDVNEMELIKQDVISELLEEEYDAGNEDFLDFTETFSSGKTDQAVQDAILTLYSAADSMPDPEAWLMGLLKNYEVQNTDELKSTPWFCWYLAEQRSMIRGMAAKYLDIEKILDEISAPDCLKEFFREEREGLRSLGETEDNEAFLQALSEFGFQTYPRKKIYTIDPDSKTIVQALRNGEKDKFAKIKKQLGKSFDDEVTYLQGAHRMISELVRLTLSFRARFTEAKRKDHLVDFGDSEHLALQILKQDGKKTAVAEELTAHFSEVMIDEYQDSNYLQEEILSAVCKTEPGQKNMTMVGDMKQSIYAFRSARPELFVGKYRDYRESEENGKKLELHVNFRSTKSVIDTVNQFFRAIMHEEVGGIEYDRSAELNLHPDDEKKPDKAGFPSEIMVLFTKEDEVSSTDAKSDAEDTPDELPDTEDEQNLADAQAEARMIGMKIRELMNNNTMIFDPRIADRRLVRYSDIVILLRQTKGKDQAFVQQLEDLQIPVVTESKSGYYDTYEVRLMLHLLQLIDNPIMDIPLTAVLLSPVFSFTEEELLKIKIEYMAADYGNGLFGAMKAYLKFAGREEALAQKVSGFLEKLAVYRRKSHELSLTGLLRYLYADTGLYAILTAMPNGERRKANLNYLIVKAENFMNTRYHGVFHFVRYIERLKETAQDEGEMNTHGENENTVRIMTVHKSKGLEFPIVFYAGNGDNLQKSENGIMDIHPDLGVGVDYIDTENRAKHKTIFRSVIRERKRVESIGEELRVMYVAMTRAREQLFITGVLKTSPADEKILSLKEHFQTPEAPLGFSEVLQSKNVMMMLLSAYRESFAKYNDFTIPLVEQQIRAMQSEDVKELEILESRLDHADGESLRLKQQVERQLYYPYLQDDLHTIPQSVPVSYLKIKAYEDSVAAEDGSSVSSTANSLSGGPGEEDNPDEPIEGENDPQEGAGGENRKENDDKPKFPRPSFMKNEDPEAMTGTAYGTLYHLVLEKIDPEKNVREELSRLENESLISKLEKDTINEYKLVRFYTSDIGKRMRAAQKKGNVFREKQFILGMDAAKVFPEKNLKPGAELVMVQGIIDLFFMEEDGIVLVDYKTDRKTEEELVQHYKKQLEIYQEALEAMYHLPVKERVLYSLYLNKEVKG